MPDNDLTQYLKTAFNYKKSGEYKKSMDFFYKALAIDNQSIEIMHELAVLYKKLCLWNRAIGFYEQILNIEPKNYEIKFEYAKLLKIKNDTAKAKNIFSDLYNENYETEKTAAELFPLLFEKKPYK